MILPLRKQARSVPVEPPAEMFRQLKDGNYIGVMAREDRRGVETTEISVTDVRTRA